MSSSNDLESAGFRWHHVCGPFTTAYDLATVWDSDGLRPAGELYGHTDGVRAVGTWTRSDGTTALVTAGDDGVRLWDADSWQPAGGLLPGHTGCVSAVGTWTRTDGTTVLVTAGDDGVRLWNPDSQQGAGELHGNTGGVSAVSAWPRADGTIVLATAGMMR